MRREGRPLVRLAGRWRSATLPAVAAVLVVVERALVGEVGSPTTLLRALPGHGDAWADPVVPVLALMALVAETLIGYVLVVLVLRWSCGLPGALGRVAGRMALLLTPAMTRRALDLLVGGTLLAQSTLAATPVTPGGHRPDAPGPAMAVSATTHVRFGPAVGSDAQPGRDRPGAGTAAPAGWTCGRRAQRGPPPAGQRRHCRPGWGAGRPTAAPGYTVEAGDTLWDIAAAHLPPAERSVGRVHRYWQQVYRANRRVIGADPDLIHPGTRLDVGPVPVRPVMSDGSGARPQPPRRCPVRGTGPGSRRRGPVP